MTRPRWEYTTLAIFDDSANMWQDLGSWMQTLDRLGEEGWEVVGPVPEIIGGTPAAPRLLLLKRQTSYPST